MSEKKYLFNLVRNLAEQDYSLARRSLSLIIEAKMKNRINKAKDEMSKKTVNKKDKTDDDKFSKMKMKMKMKGKKKSSKE